MASPSAPLAPRLVETSSSGPAPLPPARLRTHALAQLVQFIVEATDSASVVQRAIASLGLLPEVHWAALDTANTPPDACAIELGYAGEDGTAQKLTVQLANPNDLDARQAIDGLLQMIRTIHGRVREIEALRAEARSDALTGLWNRRGFTPFLEQAVARAARTGEDVTLLVCDLDNFKSINDAHGHHAGDEALRCVGRALRAVIRPTDAAARLGGDEMALLLSGCSAQGATVVARRLQEALREENTGDYELTLSIGIADTQCLSANDLSRRPSDALTRAADEAMYSAKEAGRDCFRCHPLSFAPSPFLEEDLTSPISLRTA